MEPCACSNMLWSFAKLGCCNQALLEAADAHTLRQLQSFIPQAMVRLLASVQSRLATMQTAVHA